MRQRTNISPSVWATGLVIGLLLFALVTDFGYVEWRNREVETVSIGATEAEVIDIMGTPERDGVAMFTLACDAPTRCFEWSVHNNYQYVCFDRNGRVICRGTYTVWI